LFDSAACLYDGPRHETFRKQQGVLTTGQAGVRFRDSPETADVGGASWPRVSSLLAAGTVTSSELERENVKLIYSFDIKISKSGVTEVNAIDGKIVAVAHENAKKEADEKKQEEKEKKKQ
jgi:hypothetical protein